LLFEKYLEHGDTEIGGEREREREREKKTKN
jgi:hypothetical protein